MTTGQPISSAPAGALKPRHVFAGKYLIERMLGAGGMGVVVAAMAYRIDLFASEVTWQREDGRGVDVNRASSARVEIAEYLQEIVADRPDVAQAVPARFRARIVTRGWSRELTLGFEAGKQYVVGRHESDSMELGVYGALYQGLHPEASAVPALYSADQRRKKWTSWGLGALVEQEFESGGSILLAESRDRHANTCWPGF